MSNEPLGIVAERQAIAAKYARFAYRAPVILDPTPPAPALNITAPNRRPRPVYEHPQPSAPAVLDAVAKAFNVTVWSLTEEQNKRIAPRPRYAATLLFRRLRKMSYPAIGRILKRDHSTIMAQVEKAKVLLRTDADWAKRYHAAEHLLRPAVPQ